MNKEMRPFALWLIPEAGQEAEFQQQINGLCRRFGANPFPPHMTLFAGSCDNPANLGCGFNEWVPQIQSMTLKVTGVGNSQEYFKTLTYTLAETVALRSLYERVARETDPRSGYVLQPHLSLLYKSLKMAQRERLAGEISPPPAITFDAVALAAPANILKGWRDILSWQVLQRWRFSG